MYPSVSGLSVSGAGRVRIAVAPRIFIKHRHEHQVYHLPLFTSFLVNKYSCSFRSASFLFCCSLLSLSRRPCIIIICIMFPNDQPSPSPSASLELDGDFWGIRNGFVKALVFFLLLSLSVVEDALVVPPLADAAALVDAALVDADVTARRSSSPTPSPPVSTISSNMC